MGRSTVSFLTTIAALFAGSAYVRAQDAIGDGRALDANPSLTGRSRNNAVRDFAAEKEFRDSIVTGNSPAGLSFRGDVGYRAPGELMIPVGSDAIYRYRRDSLYSGLSGMGIRGTEAIQRQFGLTTGTSVPQPLAGSLTVSRSYAFRPGGQPVISRPDSDGQGETVAVTAQGGQLSSLRSTAAYNAVRSMEPALLDVRIKRGGQLVGFMASGLRGVYVTDLGRRDEVGLPTTAVAQPSDYRVPNTLTDRYQSWAGEQPSEAQGVDMAPAWRRRLDELRATFDEEAKADEEALKPPTTPQDQPTILVPEPPLKPDPETVRMLREAPGRLALARPDAEPTAPYDVLMREAGTHLGAGRYFDAEDKFTRALAQRAGDPLAAVGRIHAQIGAGLYRSAAMNLRELLIKTPELLGAKYDASALPARGRLETAMQGVREYLDGPQASSEGRVLACLLAAYVGFQAGDDAMTSWALRHWAAQPGTDADALFTIVREVWSPETGVQPE